MQPPQSICTREPRVLSLKWAWCTCHAQQADRLAAHSGRCAAHLQGGTADLRRCTLHPAHRSTDSELRQAWEHSRSLRPPPCHALVAEAISTKPPLDAAARFSLTRMPHSVTRTSQRPPLPKCSRFDPAGPGRKGPESRRKAPILDAPCGPWSATSGQ